MWFVDLEMSMCEIEGLALRLGPVERRLFENLKGLRRLSGLISSSI
jgi:hypothetical protein